MKKFIEWLFIFFGAVIALDCAFGATCRYLNSHAMGGDTKSHYYIAKECNEDILIMGSSRARHHYVPSILSDSLGMSVYNCGTDGNGVILMYSRLLMVSQRYLPKIIIYDLNSSFDFAIEDNLKYLDKQKRFCDDSGVSNVIDKISPFEKYKLYCNLYRYNGSFVQMTADNIKPMQDITDNGYCPIYEEMDYQPVKILSPQSKEWDPIKKYCMTQFIDLCNEMGIKLVFVLSPFASGEEFSCKDLLTEFADVNDISILDYYNNQEFVGHSDLFGDTSHLNDKGARKFTCLLAARLRGVL